MADLHDSEAARKQAIAQALKKEEQRKEAERQAQAKKELDALKKAGY